MFSGRMRNLIKWRNDQDDKERFKKGIMNEQQEMMTGHREMMGQFMESQGLIVEVLKGLGNKTTKIVKTAKVPIWTKHMTLEKYTKALGIWMKQNEDVGDEIRFQEVLVTEYQ